MEWISVEDRLPEDTKLKVVRYGKNGLHIGIALSHYYLPANQKTRYFWDFDFLSTQGTKVTHWVSLPEPPKDKP